MKHFKQLFTALLLLCCVGTATAYDFEVDGIYYNITDDTNKTIEVTKGDEYSHEYYKKYTGNVVIPESVTYNGTTYSVTSIGNYAFSDCSGLTSIEIPNSVTSIGSSAFSYCSGLTSITIPNSVTSIGDYAFYYCSGLTSIIVDGNNTKYDSRENCNAIIETETNTLIAGCKNTIIPNSVTSIGSSAFSGRTGLASITIPNSVTSIGYGAFSYCTWLTSITIPNSVTSIGDNAFYRCTGLTSVTIPNSVTSIGNNAFSYCFGLTSITIPNSVTSIGNYAFSYCTWLTSVTIGSAVTSIGYGAFSGCLLTSITSLIPAESLFDIVPDVFYEVDKTVCTLYVPVGAKETYASTGGWKDFVNIVEKDFTGIEEVFDEVKGEIVYDLNGRAVENPANGIYILNGKKVLVK